MVNISIVKPNTIGITQSYKTPVQKESEKLQNYVNKLPNYKEPKKKKDKLLKKVDKILRQRITYKPTKQKQVTYKMPERKVESIFNDSQRFFKQEMGEIKSLFFS